MSSPKERPSIATPAVNRLASRAGFPPLDSAAIEFVKSTLDNWVEPMIADVVSICDALGVRIISRDVVIAVLKIHGLQPIILPKPLKLGQPDTQVRPVERANDLLIPYSTYRFIMKTLLPEGMRLSERAVLTFQAAHENYLVSLISSGDSTASGMKIAELILLPRALSFPPGNIDDSEELELLVSDWYAWAALERSGIKALSKLLMVFLRQLEAVAREINILANKLAIPSEKPHQLNMVEAYTALIILSPGVASLHEEERPARTLYRDLLQYETTDDVLHFFDDTLYFLGSVIIGRARERTVDARAIAAIIRSEDWLSRIFPPWQNLL